MPIKTAEAIARVLSANEAAAGGSKNLDCREWMEWVTGFEFHEEATSRSQLYLGMHMDTLCGEFWETPGGGWQTEVDRYVWKGLPSQDSYVVIVPAGNILSFFQHVTWDSLSMVFRCF